ncbi:MAG: AF1514 family protein [Gallionella sp.]|nr:AF1514 family protein [Gallionella sp.]
MKHAELLTLKINIEGKEPDFSLAKLLADALASSSIPEPMLIAWFDGKKGEEHPHVPECQHKPGWLAYAEGHGGRVRIDVNNNQYSFIYADVAAPEE